MIVCVRILRDGNYVSPKGSRLVLSINVLLLSAISLG